MKVNFDRTKCDNFYRRTGTEGGEFPESLYRGGCRDDHYFLRDPDAGTVVVFLDGEDRAGCGSEWREDQGDATGAEGIEVISQRDIPHLATDFFVPIRVDTDEYRKNYIAY